MAELLDIPEIEALMAGGGLGSLVFDASKLQHINHGRFWRPDINYSHCFWEGWFKPSASLAGPGYMVTDTQGGNHTILWGMQPATAGFASITGNMHDGTTLTSFDQAETIPLGHWIHLAVGWDGVHLLCWTDGILTHVQAYAPAQRKNPGGNDQTLCIGGSDHNNWPGNIAWVRAYEGYGRCTQDSDFTPELYCRPLQFPAGAGSDMPQFCVSYQTQQGLYIDTGKFEGIHHHGVPEAVQATGYVTGGFIGTTLSLPTFQIGVIDTGSFTPTPPATPSGAIIWDSFSRVNRTPNNPTNYTTGTHLLGDVEVGGVTWTAPDGTTDPGGAGVLNGRCFIVNNGPDKVVETSTQNIDVRINRLPTTFHYTGMVFRYKDGNDSYRIIATDTQITVTKREGGVETAVGYTPSAGWTTLRAVANGTSFNIYTGTGTEGTFTLQGSFTGTDVAGATRAGIGRPPGVKTAVYYDNFLVKAA